MLNITNHQGNVNQIHNDQNHLTSVRMAIIKKTRENRSWWGYGEKGTLVHCLWECKLEKPLWKTVWLFLKKLKIESPYDPGVPLLGIYIYPQKMKSLFQRDVYILMFIAALLTIANVWKQPKYLSTDEWIKKMWYI